MLTHVRYHWALLASPKAARTADETERYHATNTLLLRDGTLKSTWEFEQLPLPQVKAAKLLVKVLVGKIESSRNVFEGSLKKVPIVQDVGPHQKPHEINDYMPNIVCLTEPGMDMSHLDKECGNTASARQNFE
jgi:hypothetical protein